MISSVKKLAGALALALALTACANSPSSTGGASTIAGARSADASDPASILQAAAARTQAAGSARMAFAFAVEAKGKSRSFEGRADLSFGDGGPAEAEARMRFTLPKTKGADLGSFEMIMVAGPVIYLSSPLFSSLLGAKTPWVKIDPSTVPGFSDQLGSLTGGQADPSGSLGLLYGLVDVKEVGVETVDGVQATRYQAVLDVTKALDQVPAEQRASLRKVIENMRQQGPGGDLSAMPVDVWVDGDGYLKRFAFRLEVPASGTGGSGAFSMTVTLSNVGEPIDIQPPPADQVTDVADLVPTSPSP